MRAVETGEPGGRAIRREQRIVRRVLPTGRKRSVCGVRHTHPGLPAEFRVGELLCAGSAVEARLQLEDRLGAAAEILGALQAEAAARPYARRHLDVRTTALGGTEGRLAALISQRVIDDAVQRHAGLR